jgi:uncharacterized lipoprotein YajG
MFSPKNKILILLSLFLLTGCGDYHATATVTVSMIQKCNDFCSANGGIGWIQAQDQWSGSNVAYLSGYHIICTCSNRGQISITEPIKN